MEDKQKNNSSSDDLDAAEKENTSLVKRAQELGIEYLSAAPKKIKEGIVSHIPKDVAIKYQMAAFEKDDKILKVAMVNPQDINALNSLRFIAEKEKIEVDTYLVSTKTFEDIFKQYEGPSEMIKEAVASFRDENINEVEEKEEKLGAAIKKKEELMQEAPVAKLVQVIISHAIDGQASDIHIEPMEGDYRVRFRVDGILHVSLSIPKELGPIVVSRIKILANLKIDEKRKPQDGRFRITENGSSIDFRVSSLPVINGEKVVMRILDKDKGLADLGTLGMMGTAMENLKESLEETYGMILMTGPTGSGKSTTLYALLKILNKDERNIITLEDPVEYNIEGLNQSQVKPEIGYTFASGLRTILRQDPNVIMVGEIRDSETAELAVHAALTGHLMFSTLHTNTAIGAVPRLIDMGIEPFLLGSSLRMVMAQRLARKICEDCKEERKISERVKNNLLKAIENISKEELKKYDIDIENGIKVYQGKGCEKCNGTGLKGRIAIYEVVPIKDTMKNIISEKSGEESLLIKARDEAGIITMKQDGILKILKGFTTIEEIERVTEGNITLEEEVD